MSASTAPPFGYRLWIQDFRRCTPFAGKEAPISFVDFPTQQQAFAEKERMRAAANSSDLVLTVTEVPPVRQKRRRGK